MLLSLLLLGLHTHALSEYKTSLRRSPSPWLGSKSPLTVQSLLLLQDKWMLAQELILTFCETTSRWHKHIDKLLLVVIVNILSILLIPIDLILMAS